MPGLFELKTASDLVAKLRRELARMEKDPADPDAAFNFFVTAEHVAEWCKRPPGVSKDKAAELAKQHVARTPAEVRIVDVVRRLANGGKHFNVKRVATDVQGGAFDPGVFQADAFDTQEELVVLFEPDDAKELGPRLTAVELARRVLDMWEHSPDL